MAKFTHVNNAGVSIITALIDGDLHTVTSEHERFPEILQRLLAVEDDDSEELAAILDLFDPVQRIMKGFAKVSTRVAIQDGQVLYEGDPVHSTLANEIVRFHNEGDSGYEPLAKFLEKVYQNPNAHSREMLFDWISEAALTINKDGDIVGYRGLNRDFTSRHSGGAIVNGTPFNGQVPNNPGNVIEMARGEVTFDPNSECAYGLHIGTYNYARSWGDIVVECVIDPTDVVSVPTYDHRKMRVCRYRVVDVVESKYEDSYLDYGYESELEDWEKELISAADEFDRIEDDDEFYRDYEEDEDEIDWDAYLEKPKDTSKNHLAQLRGPDGRFIKKGN